MTRARPYDRDKALDAALDLFWTKGFHATSLKDLETELDMRPGSIYAAFSSKEALFRAALERYFERTRAGLGAELAAAGSPLQALSDHLRRLGRAAAHDPRKRACMLVKTLLNSTPEDGPIADEARSYLDGLQREIAAAFERARQCGELPPDADPDRLARRYQSDIAALKIEGERGTPPGELEALAERMASEVDGLRVGRLEAGGAGKVSTP